MRWVGIVAVVLLLSGCTSEQKEVTGLMVLHGGFDGTFTRGDPDKGDPCEGQGGYDDLREGAQVTIRDENNEVLAVGALDEGKILTEGLYDCAFFFEVPEVPLESSFYSVEVASRGEQRYPADEFEHEDFAVTLELGGE